jgi:DNA-binding transcriptional LysR family regulator
MDRIDAMQAFVAVADLAGFAPAARKLGLSPSGVTRLIAALEDRLGARLLQRTTRKVALTDVGARYLERARRILADVEEAENSAEGERTRPGGRLVVSAPNGFGRLHVSPVMSAYLKRYPEDRSAAVGSGRQPRGRRRRSRRADRSPPGFDPGGASCRRDAADRGRFAGISPQPR